MVNIYRGLFFYNCNDGYNIVLLLGDSYITKKYLYSDKFAISVIENNSMKVGGL